jgi:hypothetical protein
VVDIPVYILQTLILTRIAYIYIALLDWTSELPVIRNMATSSGTLVGAVFLEGGSLTPYYNP